MTTAEARATREYEIAAHEIGHAMVMGQADITMERIVLEYSFWSGEAVAGYCQPPRQVQFETEEATIWWVTGYAAGYVAQQMWAEQYDMGPIDRNASSASDVAEFHQLVRDWELALTLPQADAQARHFLGSRWGEVENWVDRLVARRRISGI